MNYTIIEDCSPFYIRFTFEGLDKLIDFFKGFQYPEKNDLGFRHIVLNPDTKALEVLDLVPMSKQMPFMTKRVSMFMTEPGMYYGAHKDGPNHRFSINFTVMVLDDKCVTSWYSDEDLKDYEITRTYLPSLGIDSPRPNNSREIVGWDRSKHTPIKSMIAKPNEAILFNTDIFHDWDNRQSTNRRAVLTLRHADPGQVYFEDARKILFGY